MSILDRTETCTSAWEVEKDSLIFTASAMWAMNPPNFSPLDTTVSMLRREKTRRMLESFHGAPNSKAIETAWPYLSNKDYHLRYAARIAIEWQDPKSWADKAYTESNDVGAIHALLSLARSDLAGSLQPSIKRLTKVDFSKLNKQNKLDLLRTYAVIMSRGGKPEADQIAAIGNQLDPHYPANDDNLNEELCRVLCYLQHPSVVGKTITLLKNTKAKVPDYDPEMIKRGGHYGRTILAAMKEDVSPNVLNIHFLFCLKDVVNGWSMNDRKAYLGELKELLTKKGEITFPDTSRKSANLRSPRFQRKTSSPFPTSPGKSKGLIWQNFPVQKDPVLFGRSILLWKN